MIYKNGYDYAFDENKCERCGGKCCYGESGYIFINVDEMQEVSRFLNMDFQAFTLKYIRKVKFRFSLIEQKCEIIKSETRDVFFRCVFFNETTKKCDIYPVRPRQCRTFPFWEAYKKDKTELFSRCVGVCGLATRGQKR